MTITLIRSNDKFQFLTRGFTTFEAQVARDGAVAAQAAAELAEDGAQTAEMGAVAARAGSEAARDIAAGYASDAVSQGNVPIYATTTGISGLSIPAGINAIRVNGYAAVGDLGEGALLTSVDNGTPALVTSAAPDARPWYLVLGQNDIAYVGAPSTGDASAAFELMRSRMLPGETILAPGEYELNGAQLWNEHLEAGLLKPAAGATEILKLGFRTPYWDYRKISKTRFLGAPDDADLDNAANGVSFTNPTLQALSGRWILENDLFQNCDIAIHKPDGNIGNVFRDTTVLSCNYGYYGRTLDGTITGGSDQWYGGEMGHCLKAAFAFNGGSETGNGQHVFNGTIIEASKGFDVFVKNYRGSFVPLTFNEVWFEEQMRGTDPIEMFDGNFYTPRGIYLENVEDTVFRGCPIWTGEFINSSALFDNCLLFDRTDVSALGSTMRAINARTIGFRGQPILVESYQSAHEPAGNRADRLWALPRTSIATRPRNGTTLISESFGTEVGVTLYGAPDIGATPVLAGDLYPYAGQFVLPAGQTVILGAAGGAGVDVAAGDTCMYSIDLMIVSGGMPSVSISGTGVVTGNLAEICEINTRFYTAAGVAKAEAALTGQAFRFNNPTASDITLRVACAQLVTFLRMDDAIFYFNAGIFTDAA